MCITLSPQFNDLLERKAIEAVGTYSNFYLLSFRAAPLILGLLLAEIVFERSLPLHLEEKDRGCEKLYRF